MRDLTEHLSQHGITVDTESGMPGSFGTVYRALYQGLSIGVKIPTFSKKNACYAQLQAMFLQEATILAELQHPGIVKYRAHYIDQENFARSYITTEWILGGDMLELCNEAPDYVSSIAVIQQVTYQLLSALNYLHARDIIHRDIKPDNLLLCSSNPFHVKVCDFGLAVHLNGQPYYQETCQFGTAYVLAPECIEKNHFSKPSDMYAVAVTMYVLLRGKQPFHSQWTRLNLTKTTDENQRNTLLFEYVKDGQRPNLSKIRAHSKDAADLMAVAWRQNPATRPTARAALKHLFFKDISVNDTQLETVLTQLTLAATADT